MTVVERAVRAVEWRLFARVEVALKSLAVEGQGWDGRHKRVVRQDLRIPMERELSQ